MLNEEGQCTDLDALETLLDMRHDLMVDKVSALGPRIERELLLPRHRRVFYDHGAVAVARGMLLPTIQKLEDARDGQDPIRKSER